MPPTRVVFFRDSDGSVPVLDWMRILPKAARLKGHARVIRLSRLGHELRRPEADYLRDGVYELRTRLGTVNYRILYSFHGREAVVLTHGLTKEKAVPTKEIDLAIERMEQFRQNARIHTADLQQLD